MEIYILTDIFRKLYIELGCTWRQNNIMKQSNLYRRRKDNTMVKRKSTKGQRTIYKTFT